MADNHSEGEGMNPQSTQFSSQVLAHLNFCVGLQLCTMMMMRLVKKKEEKMNNNSNKFLEVDVDDARGR